MKKLLYLSAILFAFTACRKDQAEPEEEIINCPQPLSNTPDELTIGDTTNCLYRIMNDTFHLANAGQLEVSANYPIWCSYTNGFEIESSFTEGPGPSDGVSLNLVSTTMSFFQVKDGFVLHERVDTTYSGSNPVIKEIKEGESCKAEYLQNPVSSIHDQPIYFDSGAIINKSDYGSSTAQLLRKSWGYTLPQGGSSDTTVFLSVSYERYCGNFEFNLNKYIGFKMAVEGTEKLGWVQLKLVNGGLLIIDYAIQK